MPDYRLFNIVFTGYLQSHSNLTVLIFEKSKVSDIEMQRYRDKKIRVWKKKLNCFS